MLNFTLYLKEYNFPIKIGIYLPPECDIHHYQCVNRSDILGPHGNSWSPVSMGTKPSIDRFESFNTFNKIINLFITIENASRYNLDVDSVYIEKMLNIIQLDLSILNSQEDISNDIIEYLDQRKVPDNRDTSLYGWRERYWDLLVQYKVFSILFPQTLGKLDKVLPHIGKVAFIRYGSLSIVRDYLSGRYNYIVA